MFHIEFDLSVGTYESGSEREARVSELRGPIGVVNEVGSSRGRVPHLPTGRQRAGGGRAVTQVLRHARVVPGRRARRCIVEVHLALRCCSHFCWFGKIVLGRYSTSAQV